MPTNDTPRGYLRQPLNLAKGSTERRHFGVAVTRRSVWDALRVMSGRQRWRGAGLLPVQDEGEEPAAVAGPSLVFDLDRTLLPGSSLLALGRAMASSGMVSRRRLAGAMLQEARYKRRGSLDGEVSELRDEALQHIAGLPRAPLASLARAVPPDLAAQVAPGAAAARPPRRRR